MKWRHDLSHEVNEAINTLVRKAHPEKDAFLRGRHIRSNQLWVALAELHQEHLHTQQRLAEVEKELLNVRNTLRKTGEQLSEC